MEILIIRDTFTLASSTGKMYVDGAFFGYTLEDCSRGENVKIDGETCIPTGTYKLALSESRRFRRVMPMVYTEDNGYQLKNKGISFKGIRIHGGNRSKDSWGCILVAEKRINSDLIQGSLERSLTELIENCHEKVSVTVINKPS